MVNTISGSIPMPDFDVSRDEPKDFDIRNSVKDILSVHKNSYMPACYIFRGNGGKLSGV